MHIASKTKTVHIINETTWYFWPAMYDIAFVDYFHLVTKIAGFFTRIFIFLHFTFRFTFYALNMDDLTKVKKALYMFTDLFGLERFDYDTLVRFLITVKKNYRSVAYHNWTHGFHVANSIYSIVKSSPGVFKPLEVRTLLSQYSLHLCILVRYIRGTNLERYDWK